MKNRVYRIRRLYPFIIALIITCCTFQLQGQNIGPNWQAQSINEQSLDFVIKDQGNQLRVQVNQPEEGVADFQIDQPYLADADLVVPYTSRLPKGDFAARVVLRIYHTDFGELASEELILFGLQSGAVIFRDMTENKLYLNESYQLQIQLETAYTGDCSTPPASIGIRQKIVPGGFVVLGLAGVGIGEFLLRPRQKEAYDRYVLAWEEEKSAADGTPWLTEARTVRDQRRIFTYGGTLFAIGGAIWYGIRLHNYAKRKRRYQTYCQPSDQLNLQPALLSAPTGNTPGLSLKIRF